jgi:quercetin dioxygenase-like cupin family protein|tara:strand:- start:2764 stop:3129 length:366 start_codon:yes stop_codon:yes gene_type:complete
MTQLNGVQEKGWGRELIWATNEKYCGKLMFFDKKGAKFSMHFHKDKDESWYVMNGSFTLHIMNTDTAELETHILLKGDSWRNEPMLPHQLLAMEDNSIIVEVSTPDSVEDNYRIAKGDSQT